VRFYFKNFNNCCGSDFSSFTQEQITQGLNQFQYGYGLFGEVLNAGIEARETYLNKGEIPENIMPDATNEPEEKDYKKYFLTKKAYQLMRRTYLELGLFLSTNKAVELIKSPVPSPPTLLAT
jgi:hypothetical protein